MNEVIDFRSKICEKEVIEFQYKILIKVRKELKAVLVVYLAIYNKKNS